MSILFRSAATGGNGTGGGFVIIPSDVQVDDVLIVVMDVNSLNYTAGVPVGWERLQSSLGVSGGGSQFAEIYWKRVVDGDASASVTFPTSPTGSTKSVSLSTYHTDTAGKRTAVVTSGFLAETSSGTSHATPVVNVAALPAVVVSAVGKKGTTVSTITQPTGYTLRGIPSIAAGTSNNGTAVADRTPTVTGDTAGTPWTVNVSNNAATTFSVVLGEEDTPQPPTAPAPKLRRWNGTAWTTVL